MTDPTATDSPVPAPASPTGDDDPLLRVSACGMLYWENDKLIWDDYLGHRQFALRDGAEQILRWFTSWRELSTVEKLGDSPALAARFTAFTRQLLDHHVLVAEGSARHDAERRTLASWSSWGPSVRAFHFATRSSRATPFVTADQSNARLHAKLVDDPPPPPVKSLPGRTRYPLPDRTGADWARTGFLDVLASRRSDRQFADAPISVATLGALLDTAGRPVGPLAAGGNVFKTSPSGGARHPTEIYVYARNVSGLPQGVYHYSGLRHDLTRLGGPVDDAELTVAAGDQDWVANAGALLIYTGIIARSQWKYAISRAYRVLLMDVGHLSQTVYLLATALGLRITFTAALRDQVLEELVGCQPEDEVVLGVSALGS